MIELKRFNKTNKQSERLKIKHRKKNTRNYKRKYS